MYAINNLGYIVQDPRLGFLGHIHSVDISETKVEQNHLTTNNLSHIFKIRKSSIKKY